MCDSGLTGFFYYWEPAAAPTAQYKNPVNSRSHIRRCPCLPSYISYMIALWWDTVEGDFGTLFHFLIKRARKIRNKSSNCAYMCLTITQITINSRSKFSCGRPFYVIFVIVSLNWQIWCGFLIVNVLDRLKILTKTKWSYPKSCILEITIYKILHIRDRWPEKKHLLYNFILWRNFFFWIWALRLGAMPKSVILSKIRCEFILESQEKMLLPQVFPEIAATLIIVVYYYTEC